MHDANVFTQLISSADTEVYADSAYASQAHDAWLAERHIGNRILARACRNKPLTEAQKAKNRLCSGTCSIVERIFDILKLHYGIAKAKYLGLKRNALRFGLMCIGYNMKRGLSILNDCTG